MKKILDDTGLSYFYGKIKQTFATQSSVSSKANSADLATVATSGSYNDLSNKPTIPSAAANGTFSVKTKVGSNDAVVASDFTANQSSADDVTFVQGSNVTLTTDTTNRTITIAAKDTTYSTATTSANGLMSSTDKSKLDGIASGATAVSSSTVSGWGFTKNTGTVTQVKIGTTAYDPSSGVISLPAYPTDTNTHRPIQVNGTEVLGNNTTALNLKAGSNVSITNSSGTVTIASTDTNTWRPVGTGATDAAAGNHTHGITLASDSGTSSVSLAANTKYKLTAGGQSIIFTTPADNNTTYSSQAAASGGTAVSLCTTGEKYTWNNKQSSVAKLGSSTQPVYTSAAGTFATCSTYAGGTAITLNGTSKAASTASLYAPTSAGTNGQVLVSSGSGAPLWSNLSVSYPNITYSVNTASVSGAVSIDGRTPLHILTVTANVSSVALSNIPAAGHTCHVIFKAGSAMTVAIAHDAMIRRTPDGQNINLNIPAGGYAELNFLSDGTNVYVRGI